MQSLGLDDLCDLELATNRPIIQIGTNWDRRVLTIWAVKC